MKLPGSSGYKDGRGSYGIVFCILGDARFRFADGDELTLSSGDCALFSPDSAYTTQVRREFLHYTVNFDADAVGNIDFPPYGAIFLTPKKRELFAFTLERLSATMSARDTGYAMTALGGLYTLLGMFFSELRLGAIPGESYEGLVRARNYIEENFTSDFSVPVLAKSANMSRTSFVREWKRAYGITPFTLRDRLRMQRGRELLAEGVLSVAEISELCGFSDPAYFVRFFKKHEGITPGVFRRRVRE